MGRWLDHRLLHRHRSRDRPRRARSRPQVRRDRPHGRRRCRTSSTHFGERAVAVALDVTDSGQIARRRQAADEAFGGIDVLVNNAGYGYLSAVEEGDDAEVRKLFDTNFFGVVDTIKAVLPGMRARAVGPHRQHLVDDRVWSPTRRTPTTRRPSSRSRRSPRRWRKEVEPLGIKVTAIEPGAFRTDWAARSMKESSDADRRLRRERRRPQGR